MKITRFLALAVAFTPMAAMAGPLDELFGAALKAAAEGVMGGGQKQVEQSATTTIGKYDDATIQKAWSCLPQIRGEFERIALVPAENAIPLVFSKIAFNECRDISKEEGDALRHSLLGRYFKFNLFKKSASEHRSFPRAMEESVLSDASFDDVANYYQKNLERLDGSYLLSVFFDGKDFNRVRSQIENERSEKEQRERIAVEIKQREDRELASGARRKKEEAEEKQRVATREADLRSGRVKPQNLGEVAITHNAEIGVDLASAPKVRPDGKLYALPGKIAIAGESPEFLAQVSLGDQTDALIRMTGRSSEIDGRYFSVKIPKALQAYYFDNAKINGGFDLVGRYVSNFKYKTVAGQEKSAPVFEAVYFVMR